MAISNGPLKPLSPHIFPGQVKHSPTVATVGPDGGLDIKPRDASAVSLHSRRQPSSRPGGSSPKASSSEDSRKLPIDASDGAGKGAEKGFVQESAESAPGVILQKLMEKFIFLKEKGGKAEAFKALQKSFAMNAAILSPYFIPLKDLMNLIMELETFIGKSSDHIGKTPEQVLRGFLQTGFINDNQIPSPYVESLDNDAKPVSNPQLEG